MFSNDWRKAIIEIAAWVIVFDKTLIKKSVYSTRVTFKICDNETRRSLLVKEQQYLGAYRSMQNLMMFRFK